MQKFQTSNGYEVIVDDDDAYLQKWSWYFSNGKVCRNRRTGERAIHRIIMKAKKGEYIDHINRNPLDNRKLNLRTCTNQQNNFNRGPSKGRFKGPSWHKTANKWACYIKINGKTIYLGLFQSEEEAAHAYDSKAKELFGEFAGLNFP